MQYNLLFLYGLLDSAILHASLSHRATDFTLYFGEIAVWSM